MLQRCGPIVHKLIHHQAAGRSIRRTSQQSAMQILSYIYIHMNKFIQMRYLLPHRCTLFRTCIHICTYVLELKTMKITLAAQKVAFCVAFCCWRYASKVATNVAIASWWQQLRTLVCIYTRISIYICTYVCFKYLRRQYRCCDIICDSLLCFSVVLFIIIAANTSVYLNRFRWRSMNICICIHTYKFR